MSSQLVICLIIFILAIVAYCIQKIPMAATAMAAVALLVITGVLPAAEAATQFASTNILLMGAVLVFAAGLNRTSIIRVTANAILKLTKDNFNIALLAFLFFSGIAVSFIGNITGALAILGPIFMGVCDKKGISYAKVMFPLSVAIVSCNCALPGADAAYQIGLLNGFLQNYGFENYVISLGQWVLLRIPTIVVIPLIAYFISYKKFAPDTPPVAITVPTSKEQECELKPWQNVLGAIVFVIMIIGMIFADQIGIPTWISIMVCALIMVFSGILPMREAKKDFPIEIILIFAGSLCLARALELTGAMDIIGNVLASMFMGSHSTILINSVMLLIPLIVTQFMFNRALSNIFPPMALMACKAMGANPIGPVVLALTGVFINFFTPMASPVVPLTMALGGYDQKSLLKQAWCPTIFIAVVNIAWVSIFAPPLF